MVNDIPKIYAVAECNHRTCHLCSLRLRALYKNKNCAYCKTEQTKVIFTRDPEKPFQDYEDIDIPFKDEKLNIFCEDQEIYDDIMTKLRFNCPDKNCQVVCDGWQDLKKHVKREHKLWLCDLCIQHKKKLFAHEHKLYTNNQLDRHYQEGDESGFTGHPRCDFCFIDFYGDDELYEHCRSSHEQCHICLRAGVRNQYYINYGELEKHFRNDHFLCLNQECLDKKFIVFETDIDLKAHELETHGSYVSGQRAKQQARRIEVNFISYGESRFRNRQRNQERQVSEIRSENRSDDNDGGGSTIEEAVQQIRNMNISRSNSSSSGGTNANARVVRPPPGFGVLSHNEVISPPDEPPPPPPQNIQRNRTPNPTVSRVRDDEFPTLSAASRVTNNAGIPPRNYSEKVRGSRSLVTNKSNPTSQQRSTSNGKGKASTLIIQPMQRSSNGSSSKGKELAHMNTEFPALEPSSPPQKTVTVNKNLKIRNSNKPASRVLVIKSSSGARPSGT